MKKLIITVLAVSVAAGMVYKNSGPVYNARRGGDNPTGRVYLKNGNIFEGEIEFGPAGGVLVSSAGRGIEFSPEKVCRIRLSGGAKIDLNSIIALENVYSGSLPKEIRYDHLIRRYARKNSLDEELLRAVIRQESGFNYMAVSHKGACGLMQLMPLTAERYGVENIFDPAENIRAGTRHLANLIALYGGDKRLALAAYNAGSAAVARHGGIPPFRETRHYVRVVYSDYRNMKGRTN